VVTHPERCWTEDSISQFLHSLSTGQGICIPLALVRIPAGCLHTPGTGQDTCRVPAYPWLWPGYLQGACIPLALVRIPAGCLHTPGIGQDTCRVPAYPWHWSGYLQGACIPLALVRIPAGCLDTPGIGQDMKEAGLTQSGNRRWLSIPQLRTSENQQLNHRTLTKSILLQWPCIF